MTTNGSFFSVLNYAQRRYLWKEVEFVIEIKVTAQTDAVFTACA